MILAFAGLKGGQGRSTLVVRLGARLAAAGHRVVVVDLAAAGTASLLLGMPGGTERGAGSLLGGESPAGLLRLTPVHERLFVIASDPALATIDRLPVRDPRRNGLPALAKQVDFVLLDAPPSGGTASLAAVRAANWVLVPCVPDEAGLAGLHASLDWVAQAGGAAVLGVIATMTEPRTRALADGEAALRATHGRLVLRQAIRRDPTWRSAATLARSLRTRTPKGADADVAALKREIVKLLVRRA